MVNWLPCEKTNKSYRTDLFSMIHKYKSKQYLGISPNFGVTVLVKRSPVEKK